MLTENLKYYRNKKKFSQKELAEKVGVSQSLIASYENHSKKPSYETIVRLSRALEIPAAEFMNFFMSFS